MPVDVRRVPLDEILPLRELYRDEMRCQIVHDSLHARGVTDCYAIRIDGRMAGYGCVLMLFDCAERIASDTVLFDDAFTTDLRVPGAVFRKTDAADQARIFTHTIEPVGDWIIEADGAVAATGGILFHYNLPYGDVFMEVAGPFRRRGYGSYLVRN